MSISNAIECSETATPDLEPSSTSWSREAYQKLYMLPKSDWYMKGEIWSKFVDRSCRTLNLKKQINDFRVDKKTRKQVSIG